MNAEELTAVIHEAIGQQVEVDEQGLLRYTVRTPFTMEDGDHYNIVLRGQADTGAWVVTDEGDTLMHLSYRTALQSLRKGNRKDIMGRLFRQYGIDEIQGELRINTNQNDLGNAVFTFLQALTRVTDLTYLNREIVRATFMEDFRALIQRIVPAEQLILDYHHPQFDRSGLYPVDAAINHRAVPLFIFAIGNDDRCRDTTIKLLKFKEWKIRYHSVTIFADQQEISRDVLARFSDAADKQFSSLMTSEVQIAEYLQDFLTEAA